MGEASTSQARNEVNASRHDAHQSDIVVRNQDFLEIRVGPEWTLARKRNAFQAFPVEEILLELKKALRARLTIVSDEESRRHPDQHMERLQQVSEELERLEQQLPAAIDPQLRHYLQRRSYSKALECLDAIHGEQVFNPVGGGL